MKNKKKILLVNDDGYQSAGFYPLYKALAGEYEVTAVAPDGERSWIGKSISAHGPLEVKKSKLGEFTVYACSGTPADCAQIGLHDILRKPPDLLVSGINVGQNTGHARILSSGTIGAAMEAAFEGVRSLCASLYVTSEHRRIHNFSRKDSRKYFENAAQITLKIAKIIMNQKFGNDLDIISVNIPFEATVHSEFEVTRPHREPYGKLFHKKGNKYIYKSPLTVLKYAEKNSDYKALSEGRISITPLSLELSSRESFHELGRIMGKKW
ncbi:MAG: 5'/3'-nucleotidase SurE [Patescibacteria group bacterium]|jgi:5'-nucleotidase